MTADGGVVSPEPTVDDVPIEPVEPASDEMEPTALETEARDEGEADPDHGRFLGEYFQRGFVFLVVLVVGFGLLFAAYSNHFDNGFHFDDSHVITDNLYLRSLDQWQRFFTDALTFSSLPANAMYRPLLTLSYAIDYQLGDGLDPRQFHTTQFGMLLLLTLSSFYLFLRIMNASAARWWNKYLALFGALLFSIHTANTETVNYLSSRSDLVSTLAVVLGFVMYVAWPRLRPFQLYLIPMVVGTLAKPPAVLFAPLLLAYILLFEYNVSGPDLFTKEGWRRVWLGVRRTIPAFVVAIAMFFFVESMNPPTQTYGGFDRLAYLLTQPFIWFHYLRLFFIPVGLTADTDMGLLRVWYDSRMFAGVITIALIVFWGWRASRTQLGRPVTFGLLWFCVALMPASSVIPLAEVANEHRIFFPYLGLALAVPWAVRGWLVDLPARWPRVVPVTASLVAVSVLVGHGVGTYQRNQVWSSDEALWADVVEKSPENGRAWMNYGLSQMSRGRFGRAKELFEEAQRLTPNYSILETNLGIVTDRLGDPVAAEGHFQRALQLNPDYAAGLYFYARWLVAQGRADEALPRLVRSTELSQAYMLPRAMLMHLYYAVGDDASLQQLVGETLSVAPEHPIASAFAAGGTPVTQADGSSSDHFDRGRAYTARQQHLEAAVAYRHSVEVDETAVDSFNNYGWSVDTLGFHAAAVPILERAVALRPDFELAINNLTMARRNVEAETTAGQSQ